MTNEQYYWFVHRPQMLRQAVGGFGKEAEPAKTMTVHLVWNDASAPTATLFINGEQKEYGKPIALQPGQVTVKVACNSSHVRFNRFSFEDQSVDHSVYEYETTVDFTDTMAFDAIISTYWS